MRYEHPEFTLRPVDELTPPMPSWNDNPRGAIFWKEAFARDLSEDEFAKRLGISYGTLRNARTKFGLTHNSGRVPRGKPKE